MFSCNAVVHVQALERRASTGGLGYDHDHDHAGELSLARAAKVAVWTALFAGPLTVRVCVFVCLCVCVCVFFLGGG